MGYKMLTERRFYNTTYILFASSVLLLYIVYEASESEKSSLFGFVEMAVTILEAMEDCVVAKKAAIMVQRASERAKEISRTNDLNLECRPVDGVAYESSRTFNDWWGPLNLVDGDIESSYLFGMGTLQDDFDMHGQVFTNVGATDGMP